MARALGPIKNMRVTDPVPGGNMYLTIDINLQTVAADSFPDSLKVRSSRLTRHGEVLVMMSSPRVDPNIFFRVRDAALEKLGDHRAPRSEPAA